MLDWVLDRNSVETHGKYRNPAEFTLLSWDVTKPLKQPKAVAFEEYKEPVITYPSWTKGRQNDSYSSTWEHRDTAELKKIGLTYMDRIEMTDPIWEKYSTNPYQDDGVITSIQRIKQADDSEIQVYFKLHGVKEKDWKEHWSKTRFSGAMFNTWLDNKDKDSVKTIVIVRNIREWTEKDEAKEETSALDNLFRGPYGQWISKEGFVRLTAAGCCYCSDPIKLSDEGAIKWVKMGHTVEPLCAHCQKDPSILDEINCYMDDNKRVLDNYSDYMD